MTEEQKTDLGLLILRVSLGIVFLAHGWLKVFTFGLERATQPERGSVRGAFFVLVS